VVAFGLGVFLGSARSQSYTFTTLSGAVGVTGAADGTNSDARFNYPTDLTLDDAGTLYVAELFNHTVRKMTPVGSNWVVTTLAGLAPLPGSADGTNSDARFNRPMGVTVNRAGDIFVADKYNDTIRKLTRVGTDWVVSTVAGQAGVQASEDGTNGFAHFWGPSGVAVNNSNHLFVVDSSNHTIRGLVPEGSNWVVSTLAGTPLGYGFYDGLNDLAEFDYPYSVAISGSDTLYVTDFGNNAIRQITHVGNDWSTVTIAGFSGLAGTNDGPAATAKFSSPAGIAVDAQTNIYVTDYGNQTIRKLTPTGVGWVVSTIGGVALQAGSADGTGAAARFWRPWGIAVDRVGNLFVADYHNQTIRKGTPLLPPRPALQIALSANRIVLSWPATASDYQLETSKALDPAASWTELTNGIVVLGGSYVLTNTATGSSAFYRLHHR
jgi:hypothetical protein